jgi:tetratricopeptide (TPR) repeat protein
MNDTTSESINRRTQWTGRAVVVVALVLFGATLSPVFFPGSSASLVAEHLGLMPIPPLSQNLWGWCIRLLALIPGVPPALLLNGFSAACAAAALWLVFQITLRIRHDRTYEESMARFSGHAAQLFSAVCAALMLMLSIPFWMVATRAHPLTLSLVLGLSAFYLLMRYGETRRLGYLYGSVFVYGLGITEYAALIPLALLYGIMLLLALWRAGTLRAGMVFRVLGIGLLGLSPYFIAAGLYLQKPAIAWLEFRGYFHVLWFIWAQQYALLVHGLPKLGWLTVGMVSLVPWIVVMGFRSGGRPHSRGVWFGTFVLHGLLSVLAVALLFNFTLSPYRTVGQNPLLVTPYVLIALWSSYVAGYWYAMLIRRTRDGSSSRRPVLAIAYVVLLLALGGVALWRNLPEASGRSSVLAARFADEQIDSLQGRTWLISAGELEEMLVLAAWQKGVDLKLINPRLAQSDHYGRYVASLFEEPRYKSLARVGLIPLLNVWLRDDPTARQKVAIVNAPDIWLEAGMVPQPSRTLFLGEAPEDAVDVDAIATDFGRFWERYALQVKAAWDKHGPLFVVNRRVGGHLAKVANNLGVYLEDHERPDLALGMYQKARDLDTNNVSALLNLHALARRENLPEREDLEAELEQLSKRIQSRHQIWGLSYYHGYIRSPEMYATRGWAWAMSGKQNLAINDMKRALQLSGDHPNAQLALAGLYFAQERDTESREAYERVLEANPTNQVALLGLARTAMRSADYDSARGYLERLRELKAPPRMLAMELAVLDSMSGDTAAAVARLTDVVKAEPDNMRAWSALAVIAAQGNDERQLQAALAKLQEAKLISPTIRLTLAQLAWQRGDQAAARKYYEELLRVQPGNVAALEGILRVAVAQGQRDEAERYVDTLITFDPGNAFGNYILGSLQLFNEQYALAESSYRASLAANRAPEVINDLAWLLRRRGAAEEAMALIQESLQMNDRNGAAWDTYGSLLLGANRIEEAEAALQKALALRPESAPIMLNVALLYEKKALYKDSMRLAEDLLARPTELSREEYESLRELTKRLRINL